MKNNDDSAASDPPRLRCMFTRKNIPLSEKLKVFKMISVDNVFEEDVFKGIDLSSVVEEAPEMQEEEMLLEIEKETHRLAVVNMNWMNAKAGDLYALFYSLVAPNGPGKIKSVAIYPTQFGLRRMEEIRQEEQEALRLEIEYQQEMDEFEKHIKPWLIARFGEDEFILDQQESYPIVEFDDDDPWKSWPNILYDNDEKTRYFFAVVECDSCATALQIYKQNNGVKVEPDGNPLDLRFIPDHMDFKHPPQDVATIKSLTPSLIRYWELLLAYNDAITDDEEGTYTHLKLFLPF